MTDLDVSISGEGRTVVWGHGLTSCRADEDAAHLFPWPDLPGTRWVRYDARGHGRSPAPLTNDDCRWDRLAGDMLAVADSAGATSFIAGGASMGCATTLHAAVTAPERVEAMLLVIPPTAWATRAAQGDHYFAASSLLDAGDVDGYLTLLDETLMPPMFASFADQIRATRRAAAATVDPAARARVLRGAAASDLPPLDALATLAAPALILAWDGDPGHPTSTAEALHATLLQSELHVAHDLDELFGWRAQAETWFATLPSGRT